MSCLLCAVAQQQPRCLQRASGFLWLSLSKTLPCVTAAPPAPPPPRSCSYAGSTPSPSGTQTSYLRVICIIRGIKDNNACINVSNFTQCPFSDFQKESHLTWSVLAQTAVEVELGCPSDAAWLTSWCALQSTLLCVLTSPALRTAAQSTHHPLALALLAGRSRLRSQSSARRLTDSTLEHRRKESLISPVRTKIRAPAMLRQRRKMDPSPRKLQTWGSASSLLWHAALSNDSGRRGHLHREAS